MYFTEEQRLAESYKLIQRGFYISNPTRPITLDTVPKDGIEFIHKSRLEDDLIQFNRAEDKQSSSQVSKVDKNLWYRKEIQKFTMYAMELRRERENLKGRYPKVIIFPDFSDEKGWCTFCLGSTMSSNIYEEEIENQEEEIMPYPPRFSIILYLSPKQLMVLIKYHFEWFKVVGISDIMRQWLCALLLCLHKPVPHTFQKCLEEFHDFCEKRVRSFTGVDRSRVRLIVSILKYYFGVKYYLKGAPLSSFKSYYQSH